MDDLKEGDMETRLDIFRSLLKSMPVAPLVDLGAGHCKFASIADSLGFPTLAIDGRSDRVPKGIAFEFREQDVRKADLRPFSIVCILGLLYHLTLDDQITLLKRCAGKTVIVDTHTANFTEVRQSGYAGRLWEELDSERSSIGNRFSFWHTEPSLRKLFLDCGFGAQKIEPEHSPGRAFWLLS